MDGRDIGTNVLPDADYKIFMTASVEVRAQRRYDENLRRNIPCDLETLKQEIQTRDELDSTRKHSPLIKAEDAIVVDTSDLTIDEVIDAIINIVKRWGKVMKQFDGFNHEEMTMGDVLAMENFDLPSVNDVIEGEVVRVTNQEVTVDIHGATEGTIYLSELTLDKVDSAKEVIKVGDKIKAMIKK